MRGKRKVVKRTGRHVFPKPSPRLLVLASLFALALGARLYGIAEPPMDFQPVRQYHSALLARGFYEWLLTGELRTLPPDGVIEPPILELAASFAYYLTGGEHLWIPRLLSAACWMVGGVFLYLLARGAFSANAALVSTAFYLLDPFGVLPSRAFMPEALMVAALLGTVYAVWRYHEKLSMKRLLIAAAAASIAFLVKPGICFWQILAVFAFLEVRRVGFKGALGDGRAYVFAALSVLPMGLWYAYGSWQGFLSGQVSSKIVPRLILEPFYWQGWFVQVGIVVGYVAFAGALLGVLLARSGAQRALLAGLWAGYLLFGLTFTFHLHTHDYYSLQLIPVVALSLGSLADRAFDYARGHGPAAARVAVLLLLLFGTLFSAVEHRTTIPGITKQGEGHAFPGRFVGQALAADYGTRAETYRKIGETVNHSRRTVLLAPDFGYSLAYHGRLSGNEWPPPGWEDTERAAGRPQPSAQERLDALRSERSAEYFVVVKRFDYYGKKADWRGEEYGELRRLLEDGFPVVTRTDDYVVFDLLRRKG